MNAHSNVSVNVVVKGIGAVEGAEWNQATLGQFPTLGAMGWGGFSGLHALTESDVKPELLLRSDEFPELPGATQGVAPAAAPGSASKAPGAMRRVYMPFEEFEK